MTPTLHDAVRAAYSSAATISGNDADSLNVFDADGNSVAVSSSVVLAKLEELQNAFAATEIADQAKSLLQSTDWVTLSDVVSGSPRLSNQADFIAYRQALRSIVVNKTLSPVWPALPKASWVS
jgi:hypothetical protein